MTTPGKLGKDEGAVTGPEAGEGSSSVGGMVAEGGDLEGTPPDVLPPRPGEEPENASRDASGVRHRTDPKGRG